MCNQQTLQLSMSRPPWLNPKVKYCWLCIFLLMFFLCQTCWCNQKRVFCIWNLPLCTALRPTFPSFTEALSNLACQFLSCYFCLQVHCHHSIPFLVPRDWKSCDEGNFQLDMELVKNKTCWCSVIIIDLADTYKSEIFICSKKYGVICRHIAIDQLHGQ